MLDVTSVGDVNVDILTSNLKDLPSRDSQILLDGINLSTGGCAANYAKASATLGLKTRLIGKIGRDFYGDFIRKDLSRTRNLDLRLKTGEKTGVTLALTFQDASRSFLTYTGANSGLSIRDVDLDLVSGRCVHIASFFLSGLREKTRKIIDHAHGKGMAVSFDCGLDPNGWRKRDVQLVKKVLSDVDVFFPNLAEGRAITGAKDIDAVSDLLLSLGPKIVALKMGAKGAIVSSMEERLYIPPYKTKVLDSTGAGDVFAAGFTYGLIRGWDLRKTGRFASAAAALKTRGYGSQRYPTRNEVLAML